MNWKKGLFRLSLVVSCLFWIPILIGYIATDFVNKPKGIWELKDPISGKVIAEITDNRTPSEKDLEDILKSLKIPTKSEDFSEFDNPIVTEEFDPDAYLAEYEANPNETAVVKSEDVKKPISTEEAFFPEELTPVIHSIDEYSHALTTINYPYRYRDYSDEWVPWLLVGFAPIIIYLLGLFIALGIKSNLKH